ncbi:hypothetical protein [Nonomuraea antimicrobica]|uniref:hypothetical protein n=1 Tax=Nonomuraea antimicrobica TaxID=561173 RepID=UPI0031E7052E
MHRSGPAAAAVVVCASVVLAAGACGGTPQAPSPASCPQHWGSDKFGDWVPDTSGVEGAADSLVPGSPVGALICAYPGENAQPGHFPLAGSRTLTGQATAMAHDLGYLPVTAERVDRACTLVGGKMTNYLVRFAYPDGQALWVGTAEEPNSCVTTTNGTVNTPSYVGPSVSAVYRTGTWRLVQRDDPCGPTLGRRGQNEQMVPEGPVKVRVCRQVPVAGSTPRPAAGAEHGEQEARDLAEALNSLGAEPGGNTCQGLSGAPREMFYLHFGYAQGPPAWVRIQPGCRPSVNNGLLVGDLADGVLDRVVRLAPPG